MITEARRGERLFNNAKITFHRQLSCHTCHPDGHVDGLTYDIESDGIGVAPVDNRTLRGILDTGPFKWSGTNPTLSRQCGPRLSVFFTRIQPFTRRRIGGRGSLYQHDPEAAESPPPARRRADPRPAARQGDLRAHHDERRPGRSPSCNDARHAISPLLHRSREARRRHQDAARPDERWTFRI